MEGRGCLFCVYFIVVSIMTGLEQINGSSLGPMLGSMKGMNLTISTIVREPFLFDLEDFQGNTRRVGYIKDLVDQIQKRLKFDYDFLVVPDGNYGTPNANGVWNGMVGELVNDRVDMIAADLTVNAARSEVVDFTSPYLQIDLGVVYKKPAATSEILSFMLPFANEVWYTILGCLLITSACLYLFGVYNSPDDPLASVPACLYFGLACLFAQGPETYPKSIPSRATAISWWFFSLIMLTLYMASLTSMLTVNKATLPIETIDDLIGYEGPTYAIEPGHATEWAFQTTPFKPFQDMYKNMEGRDDGFYAPAEGMQRVRDRTDFVFIRESPYIAYDLTYAPCDLEAAYSSKNPNSGSGYGFAFPKDSPLTANFSAVILGLIEDGTLADIYTKWFQTRNQCSAEKKLASSQDELGFEEIRGIFYTFSVGIGIAFFFFGIKVAQTLYDKHIRGKKEGDEVQIKKKGRISRYF